VGNLHNDNGDNIYSITLHIGSYVLTKHGIKQNKFYNRFTELIAESCQKNRGAWNHSAVMHILEKEFEEYLFRIVKNLKINTIKLQWSEL